MMIPYHFLEPLRVNDFDQSNYDGVKTVYEQNPIQKLMHGELGKGKSKHNLAASYRFNARNTKKNKKKRRNKKQ